MTIESPIPTATGAWVSSAACVDCDVSGSATVVVTICWDGVLSTELDDVRAVVCGTRASTDVATSVSGLAVIREMGASFEVLTTTVGDANPPRPADGNIAHITASESRPPIAPVVSSSPRPIVMGGSEWTHTALPISEGWRHARS
jgi:hypothetical protein